MGNSIKYSQFDETLCIRKGNFWIGVGDVSKYPTSGTGFRNVITPPTGGYVIYLPKNTQGPAARVAYNDTDLIETTNQIFGTNYTTKNQCLNYFAGYSDSVVINNANYPKIVTQSLVLALDDTTTISYPLNGSSIYDMSPNGTYVLPYQGTSYIGGYGATGTAGDPAWANNISTLTICALIKKTRSFVTYAFHPINKWNNSTVNSSFVLYDFGGGSGGPADGTLSWYGNPANLGGFYQLGELQQFRPLIVGETAWVGLQYNSTSGGQAWANGGGIGGRTPASNPGVLGSTSAGRTDQINIFMPFTGDDLGNSYISHVLFYDRELSDAEMVQNYEAVQSRVSRP